MMDGAGRGCWWECRWECPWQPVSLAGQPGAARAQVLAGPFATAASTLAANSQALPSSLLGSLPLCCASHSCCRDCCHCYCCCFQMDVTDEPSEGAAALAEHQAATAVERALGTLGWSGGGDDPWAGFPQASRHLGSVLRCGATGAGSPAPSSCIIIPGLHLAGTDAFESTRCWHCRWIMRRCF